MNSPQITTRKIPTGEGYESLIEVRWYAQTGSFLVEATGLGSSPEAAEREARLYLGQARAELNSVTAEEIA